MKNLRINFKVVIALVLMAAIVYFAFDAVQTESLTGSELSFVTSGVVTINTTEPVTLVATSPRTYALTSTDTDLGTLRPTREGTGRDLRHVVEVELAQGRTQIQVVRGTDINFTLAGSETIDVTLAARDEAGNRNILLGAALASLVILGYIVFSTRETLMGVMRRNGRGTEVSAGASPA